MAAAVEKKHPSKDELPVAPEPLREEVKKHDVKLRPTEMHEKIVLPTDEGKLNQSLFPYLRMIAIYSLGSSSVFEKNSLAFWG